MPIFRLFTAPMTVKDHVSKQCKIKWIKFACNNSNSAIIQGCIIILITITPIALNMWMKECKFCLNIACNNFKTRCNFACCLRTFSCIRKSWFFTFSSSRHISSVARCKPKILKSACFQEWCFQLKAGFYGEIFVAKIVFSQCIKIHAFRWRIDKGHPSNRRFAPILICAL